MKLTKEIKQNIRNYIKSKSAKDICELLLSYGIKLKDID